MDVVRTPEERFAALPDFAYAPRYVDVPRGDGSGMLRMAWIEAGPATAAPILLLHGEPSWSFLYRKMIAPLVGSGHRVLAPDLVGFGRSDKPTRLADYTYQRHMDWLAAWLLHVDLRAATLFCQDWGGLLGLRLVAEHPDRFARVVAANTFLPTGDQPAGPAFLRWREFATTTPHFDIGSIVARGTARGLSDAAVAAYDAPFPDDTFKAGARAFPALVPISPNDPAAAANRRAWEGLTQWQKPFLTAFGDSDPITRGADGLLQALIPGARGQAHCTLAQAGHFLQEDVGAELATIVDQFVRHT